VIVTGKCKGEEGALTTRSVDNSIVWLPGLRDRASMRFGAPTRTGAIMAKRKKGSKVQSRAKLRRGNSAKRGKARKVAKTAKAKAAARAKPKHAPVKKAAQKVKQPVEQPAPGVVTVTEVEETEVRQAS